MYSNDFRIDHDQESLKKRDRDDSFDMKCDDNRPEKMAKSQTNDEDEIMSLKLNISGVDLDSSMSTDTGLEVFVFQPEWEVIRWVDKDENAVKKKLEILDKIQRDFEAVDEDPSLMQISRFRLFMSTTVMRDSMLMNFLKFNNTKWNEFDYENFASTRTCAYSNEFSFLQDYALIFNCDFRACTRALDMSELCEKYEDKYDRFALVNGENVYVDSFPYVYDNDSGKAMIDAVRERKRSFPLSSFSEQEQQLELKKLMGEYLNKYVAPTALPMVVKVFMLKFEKYVGMDFRFVEEILLKQVSLIAYVNIFNSVFLNIEKFYFSQDNKINYLRKKAMNQFGYVIVPNAMHYSVLSLLLRNMYDCGILIRNFVIETSDIQVFIQIFKYIGLMGSRKDCVNITIVDEFMTHGHLIEILRHKLMWAIHKNVQIKVVVGEDFVDTQFFKFAVRLYGMYQSRDEYEMKYSNLVTVFKISNGIRYFDPYELTEMLHESLGKHKIDISTKYDEMECEAFRNKIFRLIKKNIEQSEFNTGEWRSEWLSMTIQFAMKMMNVNDFAAIDDEHINEDVCKLCWFTNQTGLSFPYPSIFHEKDDDDIVWDCGYAVNRRACLTKKFVEVDYEQEIAKLSLPYGEKMKDINTFVSMEDVMKAVKEQECKVKEERELNEAAAVFTNSE